MKKQQYEEPEMIITKINTEDIITASSDLHDLHNDESDMMLFGNDNE